MAWPWNLSQSKNSQTALKLARAPPEVNELELEYVENGKDWKDRPATIPCVYMYMSSSCAFTQVHASSYVFTQVHVIVMCFYTSTCHRHVCLHKYMLSSCVFAQVHVIVMCVYTSTCPRHVCLHKYMSSSCASTQVHVLVMCVYTSTCYRHVFLHKYMSSSCAFTQVHVIIMCVYTSTCHRHVRSTYQLSLISEVEADTS